MEGWRITEVAGLLRKDDFSSTATYRHAPPGDLFLYRGESVAGNRELGEGGEIRRFRACRRGEGPRGKRRNKRKGEGKEGKRTECLPRTASPPFYFFFFISPIFPQSRTIPRSILPPPSAPSFPLIVQARLSNGGFSRILSTAGNGRGDDPLNRIRLI